MTQIIYALYNGVLTLALPFVAIFLAFKKRHRALLRRFWPNAPDLPDRPIWIHACSVGEVNTARPILRAMRERWPHIPLLLTTSTVSGRDLAASFPDNIPLAWCPFDHPASVARFLVEVRPRALVLIETELWPNLVRMTARRGIAVIIANGRLSDKHQHRYDRFRGLFRHVTQYITAAGMQNPEYVERIKALGVDEERALLTGNTKFDGATLSIQRNVLERLREENGFTAEDFPLIFGSTRPGDEELAAACWRALKSEFPQLRLILAPRHANRLDEALAPFAGEAMLRRSEVKNGRKPDGERVFVLDTVGELVAFYGLSRLAVVGGSFFPGVNGHNPLEPAALGIPTVFGPYMRNFIDPARVLVENAGAVQVPNPADLTAVLRELISDPWKRANLAQHGRDAIVANQGAIARSLDLVAGVVDLLPTPKAADADEDEPVADA